jgi:hypothetical protein
MKKTKPSVQKAIRDNSLLLERLNGHVEVTPEQRAARDATISLIFQAREDAVEQARKRKEKKDAEVFELLGGQKTSVAELSRLVTSSRSPYEPLFPNTKDFWKEIFRLNPHFTSDPTEYVKPAIVGKWVCELIYNRYIKEVLPAVRTYNLAIGNGFWFYKHFQFLTPEAKNMLEHFRDDAIRLMQTCSTWLEFRKKYLAAYGIVYQAPLFESE